MKDRPANPVQRFVVEHNNDKSGEVPNRLSIASLRDLPAYVLLGEPGLGKSLCFENEAKTCNGLYYSVADFLHLPEAEKNITADKTIFIDGLDESGEPHAIEKLRQQLSNTGWPSFRISCRAADWFGDNAAKKLTPPSITTQRKSIQVFDLCALEIDDIKTILQTEYKEHNPGAFLQRANSFGVLDLARNPQTLRYLVTAMKQGLPSDTSLTKKIVFERACSALAIERNNEHVLNKRTVGREIDTKRIITTSQQTFAFMLVTGRSGISETDNAADESWPGPMDYNQRVADVAEASHSSLFRTTNTPSHFAPAHRTIAEFLGAQWLAARIDDAQSKPLSKRRLHRLLTHDNRVVASLRGLVGWLTALSPDMFETLADADPLAIVEYGDVALLSITQRRHLFTKLIFHAGQPHEWLSRRLKHSEGMRTLLRDFEAHDVLPWLQPSEWTEAQRDSAILLLQTRMHNEAALPTWLAECAAARMRDIVTPIEIRIAALELWLNRAPAAIAEAISFLDSLAADQTLDRTNQLRAALLQFLCPHKLSAVDAVKYLVQPSQRIGEYESWLIALPSLVPTEHLDAFADAWLKANLVATYDDFVVGNVEDQLVKRLLLELGTKATAPQLLSWLHIGIQNHRDRNLQIADEIRSWLRVHIDVCKSIWAHVHDECAIAGTQWNQKIYDAERAMSLVLHRNNVDALLDDTQPFIHTMGEWLVTEATRLKTDGALQDLVLSILWNANACLPKPQTPGTRATAVEHWLQQNPTVLLHVNEAAAAFESRQHKYRVRHQTSQDRWEAQRDKEFATYLTVEAATIAGNADWKALEFLADVWSSTSDFQETKWVNALQRFEAHFGTMDNRAARVFEVTQTALLGVLYRPDLPSAEQLRTVHGNNRRHPAVRPILLAAHLLRLRDPQAIVELPPAALRTLVFSYLIDDSSEPIWLESLMHESPHVVANCWLEFTKSAFADKQYRASLIFHLASSTQTTDRESLAKLVAVPTLELLPIPLHSEHTVTLQVLLHLAWQYDRDSLSHLATQKLQYTSLDEVQATYWRLVQFLSSPKMNTEEMFTFLKEPERTQIRASLVLALLHGTHWSSFDLREYQLPPLVVGRLVELCAMSVTLADNIADGVVTPLGDDWKNRQVIDMLLRMIASVPSVAALAETMRLGALSSLAKLQKNIAWLASEQRRSILEASYQRPTLSEALKILGTDEPISREDLFERVSDVLETLGEELRTNPTTMVKRCWNLNGSKYDSPKEENECRDWLIDELKHRMRIQGSDAQPEVQFVNNKRADIVVTFRGWRLPIEIKRSMHPEVWTAWNNQVEQYIQERGTGGYAIYLILWFDVTPRVRSPGQSHAPATASAYATLLQSLIRDSGKANIRAMLLDVSEPIAKPEAKAKAKPKAESKPAKPAQPAQAKAGNARPKPAKATPAKPANSTKTSPRK